MKNYRYLTFRNFVAVNVIEGNMHFVDAIGFWEQANISELRQAYQEGRPVEGGFVFPLSSTAHDLLMEKVTPAAIEKSLQELLLLMEEGLIVIGDRNDFIGKTSYGHFAITVPEGTIYDAMRAARDDFAKDKDDICQWSWMIQATTKGWEWANRIDREIPTEEFLKERADFFVNNIG